MRFIKSALKAAFSFDRLIGYAMLAGFLVLYWWNPAPIEFARLKVFDYYVQLKPREIPPPQQKPVTIIDLDEQSLETVGQWPWPRTTIGKLIQNLMQMGAVLIAFDMVFAEEDRTSLPTLADQAVGIDDEMRARLKKLPGNDEVLANVIKRSRVVLGQAGRPKETEGVKAPPLKRQPAVRNLSKTNKGVNPQAYFPHFPAMVRNRPVLEEAIKKNRFGGLGMFSAIPDEDGTIRNVPSFFVHEGKYFPTLSIEMLRIATGRPTVAIFVNDAGVAEVKIAKGFTVNTDNRGKIWPYFSKHDPDKYVPAHEVLDGTADPAKIKGKLTILGTSAVGLRDIRTIPTARDIPGVEVHAQTIEVIAHKQYLTRPNYAPAAEMAFVLVGGLIMIVLVPWVGAKSPSAKLT